MEEVDNIILHFLRRLDINIHDDLKSLAELPVETIVFAVSKCLNTIKPELKAPVRLLPGISHRIEIAAQIATMCKDLGYKSEVGYQTFLYSNESELRQVFMFLIELLPTETEASPVLAAPSDKKSQFWQNIQAKIAEEMNKVWIPPCCDSKNRCRMGDYVDAASLDQTLHLRMLGKDEAKLLELCKQIDNCEKISKNHNTHTENHENQIASGTININVPEPTSEENVKITEIHEIGENINLKDLKEEVIILRQKVDMAESEKNSMETEFSMVQKSINRIDNEISQLESIQALIKELNISKDDGVEKITMKLKNEVQKLHLKSDECTHKNLSLRAQIETAKKDLALSELDKGKMLKALQNYKETARGLKEEYKTKEEMRIRLRKDFEKISRGGNKRATYTKRIMEIIANVVKQKVEIEKILGDTRLIQKEINNLHGQLDRSFSVADETLFKDAKKDDQAKKAYKLLALLHSECNTIVSLVNETGALSRDIVDLEDHIEAEKAKRIEDTLKKIETDLEQMHEEAQSIKT